MTLSELLDTPDYAGLAADTAAELIRTPRHVGSPRQSWVTERTIYATLGPIAGETFLATLSAVAASDDPAAPIVARALRWLAPPSEGIDVGDEHTRGMLVGLSDASGGPLAAASVTAILALATPLESDAERFGFGTVHEGDVAIARGVTI